MHDMRRLVYIELGGLGVAHFVRERLLAHVDRSMGGRHYDVADYAEDKRQALEKWYRRLEDIVDGRQQGVVSSIRVA